MNVECVFFHPTQNRTELKRKECVVQKKKLVIPIRLVRDPTGYGYVN